MAEVKLGKTKVLRVRVLGGMVALTSGRIEERKVRETTQILGGNHDTRWRVARMSEAFVESATLTVPLRKLDEVRAALAQVARLQRKHAD